jgi:hypothetical protein
MKLIKNENEENFQLEQLDKCIRERTSLIQELKKYDTTGSTRIKIEAELTRYQNQKDSIILKEYSEFDSSLEFLNYEKELTTIGKSYKKVKLTNILLTGYAYIIPVHTDYIAVISVSDINGLKSCLWIIRKDDYSFSLSKQEVINSTSRLAPIDYFKEFISAFLEKDSEENLKKNLLKLNTKKQNTLPNKSLLEKVKSFLFKEQVKDNILPFKRKSFKSNPTFQDAS